MHVKISEAEAQPSVHKVVRAGYVPAGVGAQQEGGARAVFRLPDVPERNV